MKPIAIAIVSCVLLLSGCCATKPAEPKPKQTADEGPREPVRAFMRQKLAHASAVLEGIATENFAAIERHAKQLHALSEATDWQVHKTLPYQKFSGDFRMLADELAANAKARNLEGATLNYMELTMTCVKCHTYLRREGLARLNTKPIDRWLAAAAKR